MRIIIVYYILGFYTAICHDWNCILEKYDILYCFYYKAGWAGNVRLISWWNYVGSYFFFLRTCEGRNIYNCHIIDYFIFLNLMNYHGVRAVKHFNRKWFSANRPTIKMAECISVLTISAHLGGSEWELVLWWPWLTEFSCGEELVPEKQERNKPSSHSDPKCANSHWRQDKPLLSLTHKSCLKYTEEVFCPEV